MKDEDGKISYVGGDYLEDYYRGQCVIVRIWTSASNPRIKGKDMGHVSIEIDKDHYLSLWPRDGLPRGLELVKGVPHKFLSSYEEDCKKDAEGRPAEYILYFYTLEKSKILNAFERLKEETKAWALIPRLPCTLFAESCVSSAWRLLEAGGIEKLVPENRRRRIRYEGSRLGSQTSSMGTLFLPVRSSSSDAQGIPADLQHIRDGSAFSTEMALGGVIPSPDYMAEVLIEAKRNDVLKLIEKNVPPIVADDETTISDLPNGWRKRNACVIL